MAKLHKAALNISIITALSLFGDSLLYPVLPLYAERLGVPLVMVGVVLSINRWVRLYSNHLASKTYARHSVYIPIVLASAGAAISTGMYAFPIGIIGFLVARMLWGVCYSYFRMGSYLVVLQTSHSVLGWALGLTHAISRLGSAFIAIIGGYFIDKLGYNWTMLSLAIVSALAIPLAFLLKHQLPPDDDEQTMSERPVKETTMHIYGHTSLSSEFCCIGAFITHLVASGLVTSSLSLLLQQTIGSGLQIGYWTLGIATVSGFVFSSNWLSAIFLSSTAGRFSDRYGRSMPFVVATTLQALLLFVLAKTLHPWVSVVSAILFFVLTNVQRVFLDAALGDTTNVKNCHSVAARYNSYQDFGAALGPLLGYAAGALTGFSFVYVLGAIVLLLLAGFPMPKMLRKVQADA